MDPAATLIGTVVRLQVQTGHLKVADEGNRRYDPAPIKEVAILRLEAGGVVGVDEAGDLHVDVHHRDHPISRHHGDNGVSIGFTSHYHAMRRRFGDHVADGVAGENILVAAQRIQTPGSLGASLRVETASGTLALTALMVAAPCVEFTRFCAGAAPAGTAEIKEQIRFLDEGMRAFYATPPPGPSAAIRLGDRVFTEPPL